MVFSASCDLEGKIALQIAGVYLNVNLSAWFRLPPAILEGKIAL
jgi:hypothetical protein